MTTPVLQLIGNQVAGTTAQTAAWPTGHQSGDLGILVIENNGNDTTITPPAGWTQVTGSPVVDVATTAGSKLNVWYKFATSSAEATVSTGDAGDHQVARIYVFRGVSQTGTFNASTTGTKTTASTTATWPSITTTVGETLVVFIASRPDDTNTNTDIFRNYSGGTLDAVPAELSASAEATTSSGTGGGFVLVTAKKTAPGATGTPSASMFNSANGALSVTNAYMVFALRPKAFTLTADTVTFNENLNPANLQIGRNIKLDSIPYSFIGNDATLTKTSAPRTLTADVATFTEDLKPANLIVDRKLVSATVAFGLEANILRLNRSIIGDSRFYSVTASSTGLIAIADSANVTVNPPAGYGLHIVTDISQAANTSCIYYGLSPAVAVGDQILYKTTTETNANVVSISSTGIVSTVPSGSDTLKFRHWRPSTWSAELTFTVSVARTLTADTQTYNENLQPANLLYGRKATFGGVVYGLKTEINNSALFTDTITQPNGTILGDTAEWDRWDTDNATQIVSDGTDAVIGQQNRDAAGVVVGNTSFGPDQWAEQVHSTGSSSRFGAGPIVRGSSGTTANGYVFRPTSVGLPSDRFYIHRYINGVNTTIGDSGPQIVPTLTTGTYTSRLEIIGNKLYGYINGKLVVTATDSSITSGQPGFQIFYSGGTTSFSAGEISSATTLKAGKTLLADTQSYSLTGNDVALPVKKIRYVNTTSTAGGTGKTNATTGADRAYATLRDALSTEQADLVAQNVKLEIYCAGGADSSTASQQNWPSMVTGPNNDIKIYAAAGNQAEESFNSNKYHIARFTGGQEALYLTTADNLYISFYNLQIKSTLTTHSAFRISTVTSAVTTGKVIVSGCYIEGGANAVSISFNSRNQPHVIVNSIILANGGTGSNTLSQIFYNNTVVSYSTGAAAATPAGITASSYYMRNNIFQNYGGGVALSGTLPSNTSSNITNDATSTQVSLRNITLNFRDKVGKNYRLISEDSAGIGSGTNLSNDAIYPITVDLLGSTRTTWDIGAVKYIPLLSASNRIYTLTGNDINLKVTRKLIAKVYADEQLFTDDFTGTAGPLSSNYTQQADTNVRRDGLGNANAVGAGRALAWPNTVSFSNDQYAEITVIQIDTGTSDNSGVGLRIQTNVSPAVEQGYIFKTGDKGAAYALTQYNTSSTNVVISTSAVLPKVGDRIRAVAIGNTQYFYVNDQLVLSASDSSWSSGVPAIYGNGTVWKSDNFIAGNYGGLHLAGTYTNTLAARRLVCASASYTLSLKDATLTKTVTARTLIAETAVYNENLQPANLKVGKRLVADTQTYNEDLKPANLLIGRKLLAVAEREQQVFTDDFERADQALDSTSAWLRADLEVGSLSIVSGKAVGSNIGNVYNQTLANNQWAELNFGGVFSTGTGKGAAILLRGTGGQSSFTGYSISLERDNSDIGDILRIRRHLSDTTFSDAYTNGLLVASTRVAEFASNSPDTIIKAEIIGDTIYAYVNGILALIANNSAVSSGFAGIWSDTATISTFSAGGLGPTKVTLNNANLKVGKRLVADSQTYNETLRDANLKIDRKVYLEPFRGNYLYNSSISGSSAGTPGTAPTFWATSQGAWATRTIVGTGVDSSTGLTYIDVAYSGTNNTGTIASLIFDPISATTQPAEFGQTWTSSAYFGLVSGSWPTNANIINVFRSSTSVGVGNSTISIKSISSSALQRFTATFTANNTTTRYIQTAIRFDAANNETVNFTVRIAAPQLEKGSVATSFISTNNGPIYKWFQIATSDTNLKSNRTLVCTTQTYNENLQPANLKVTRTLLSAKQTYTLTGNSANTLKGIRLLAAQTSYSFSGKDVSFRITRNLIATQATYTLTGNAGSYKTAGKVLADVRSYTLIGNAANLLRSTKLFAASTSYTLTSNAANLSRGKKVVADTQTYTLTRNDATLRVTRKLTGDVRSYTLTINDANILEFKRLVADVRSYTLTGQSANLLESKRLTADTRSYTLTGQSANLQAGKKLTADTRSYALTGNSANLACGKKLVADVSSYSLNVQSANLKVERKLTSDLQSYALTASDINLLEFKRLVADVRSYTLSGQSANLLENKSLTADTRTYTLIINDATLKVTRRIVADTRSYTLTGNNFFFNTAGRISAFSGNYTLTGNSVNLPRSRISISSTQAYNITTNEANLKLGKKVLANSVTYNLTGIAANILAGERGPSDSRNFVLTGNSANLIVTRKLNSSSISYSVILNDTNLKIDRKVSLSLSSYISVIKDINLLANRKIQLVRTFFDTNGYVEPGYFGPDYVSLSAALRVARKLSSAQTSYNFTYNGMLFARGGFIKVWTGSAWVQKPLKVWNGTAWVSKPLKIWTGSTWRTY